MDIPGGSGGRRDHYRDNRRDNYNNWNRHDDNNQHSSRTGAGSGRGRNYDRNDNRDRSRSRDRYDLMDEVNRREREKVFAKGRSYSSRPASFKESSMTSERSAGAPDNNCYRKGNYHSNNRYEHHSRDYKQQAQTGVDNTRDVETTNQAQKQKSPGELAAIEEKKRKLMAKYG